MRTRETSVVDVAIKLKDIDKHLAVSLLRQRGYSLRGIAAALRYKTDKGVRCKPLIEEEIERRLLSLLQAGQISIDEYNLLTQTRVENKRGRPKSLRSDHLTLLNRIIADPKTQHLSCLQIYKIFAQQCANAPSYHTVYRYLKSVPDVYRRKKGERYLHAHHPASELPCETWLVDRFRADVFVVDPVSGEYARPECIVVIDKATRTILALGAAYRAEENTTRKRFHFDAHLTGSAILAAIRGDLTGVPHIPRRFVMDWGKVENTARIQQFLDCHKVQVVKAAPYTPHGKSEIEGGVIAHIHTQLEANLPGYCGSDNRPQSHPACWDGKARRKLVKGVLVYTDAAGRPLLTIDEFNEELRRFAQTWNEQPDSDIRYRHIPRIERLRSAATSHCDINLQFPETYLLPGAVRTVYEDGTIQIYGRRYYHPALVALRVLWGKNAKVYARYSITNRNTVYLYYLDPNLPDQPSTEWLWMWDNPQSPSMHPWCSSQATWYNREDHREDDPRHTAWVSLVRSVNQAARRAANDLRENPVADSRLAFNYIAARIWRVVEQHLHSVNSVQGADFLQGVDAGGRHKDSGEGQGTDARPALINARSTDQQIWEIEKSYMAALRKKAEAWRRHRWR